MKYLLCSALVAVLCMTSSCTHEELQTTEPKTYKRPPILKTLAISDSDSEAYLELQIANEALLYLSEDDVVIKAHQIDDHIINAIDKSNVENNDDVSEGEWTDSDFYIDDMRLPIGYDALNISINFGDNEVSQRGCKDPVTFEANGKCRLVESGVWGRTIGFYGEPRNCNHTDWEWKRKRWWGYKKLYDRDSYSSSSVIGYSSTQKYDAYQLRIDPNNSCCFTPSVTDFNFVYGYSFNSNCD